MIESLDEVGRKGTALCEYETEHFFFFKKSSLDKKKQLIESKVKGESMLCASYKNFKVEI